MTTLPIGFVISIHHLVIMDSKNNNVLTGADGK